MNRTTACDTDRLGLLLADRLPIERQRETEAHLSVCPACRRHLETLAGEGRWWAEARNVLGGDGDIELAPTRDRIGFSLGPRPAELSFLTPSEHPESLGSLAGYEVLEVIGQGGMGIVLKAFDAALHRPVAIKVLAAPFTANADARRRFAREAQAAAAVVHEHVVAVHAVDADATPPFLVMSFISGRSLQQRIEDDGPLGLAEILRIGMQAASGLAAAHAQGLVHRDIKPANIMLENGVERVRITDFGLARAVDDASVSHSGTLAGTPQYMAPEQARGEPVDPRSDLFSLGSTLYAMAAGHPPFSGSSGLAVLRQVADIDPPPLGDVRADLPIWLLAIVAKLHAKEPGDRFQSAAEVAELLEACLAHIQQPSRMPLPDGAAELARSHTRPLNSSFGRKRTAAAVFVAIAATFGLLAFDRFFAKTDAAEPNAELSEISGDSTEGLALDDAAFAKQAASVGNALSLAFAAGQSPSQANANHFEQALSRMRAAMESLARTQTASASNDADWIGDELQRIRTRLAKVARALNQQSSANDEFPVQE